MDKMDSWIKIKYNYIFPDNALKTVEIFIKMSSGTLIHARSNSRDFHVKNCLFYWRNFNRKPAAIETEMA
ncbi:hypothetical protein T07_1492 [Trichinella nelsoni]|uniref:Uncharacterized protein n=1 Tax=Trichinella nelsoni TaxID=6336 RepID=A0A0V0RQE8_9BILA|nr:hypothetical protein T07_1492 [Trichinella nelsoni]